MTAAHGTRTCYKNGCRCARCRRGEADRARRVTRLKAYGRWEPFTDAAPVREHVQTLVSYGAGAARIATVAGVGSTTVAALLYGRPAENAPPTRRMRKETAARLLAVRPGLSVLAPGARTSACGTRRRLQALGALGWSAPAIARRLGMQPSTLYVILRGSATVTAATALRVRELYDDLWDQEPRQDTPVARSAAARTRVHAARRRWAPPQAWDDDTIDDPAARPGRWKRNQTGTRLAAADVAELDRAGLTPAGIAERTGASRAAVDRALARARVRTRAS